VAPARFGTDGIRGEANVDLTPELALALGRAIARILPATAFLVGRDTRRSGPLLQAALSAGIASEGADVIDVGVLPTPGVAFLSAERGLPGAVVSASHNPFADNGIKVFGQGGLKLSPEVESDIEGALATTWADPDRPPKRVSGHGVGRLLTDDTASTDYRDHLVGSVPPGALAGLRVVLDCAHGAASAFAPDVFGLLGAEVVALNCAPDGTNINQDCGSTHPEQLAASVVAEGAALGLAFDGDADRLVAVDHTGALADGDVLLALLALDMAQQGTLVRNTVVVTVMTNLGFRLAMEERGITVVSTDVGDRHVLAALEADGLSLGGEQSGHLVLRHRATTGDGMLAGLALGELLGRQGRPLADLTAGLVTRVPQVLINVAVADPRELDGSAEVWEAVSGAEEVLGQTGRVLLRRSGTEPVVRVMVEAPTETAAAEMAEHLATVVATALG